MCINLDDKALRSFSFVKAESFVLWVLRAANSLNIDAVPLKSTERSPKRSTEASVSNFGIAKHKPSGVKKYVYSA
jgi:hypothetical protein